MKNWINAGVRPPKRPHSARFKICLLLIGACVVVLIGIFVSKCKHNSLVALETQTRERYLRQWHEDIQPFLAEQDVAQDLLYAYSNRRPEQDSAIYHVRSDSADFKELLSDPNKFYQTLQYDLFVGHNGWFIIDHIPTRYGNKMLMIDQDGKVFEIRKVRYIE
jgi:hypothetical protein